MLTPRLLNNPAPIKQRVDTKLRWRIGVHRMDGITPIVQSPSGGWPVHHLSHQMGEIFPTKPMNDVLTLETSTVASCCHTKGLGLPSTSSRTPA